ncbi:MAG: hypothetical protein NTV86_14685 [Planctomycetota bacterium]|nr:hypothetical protein [Planctomycetota bacterium]
MSRRSNIVVDLHADQAGQASLEWVLLVSVFGLPLAWFAFQGLFALAAHYRMVTFVDTLPLP